MEKRRERTDWERETLVFPDQERAESFRQEVGERLQTQNEVKGVDRTKEKIGEIVAEQIAAAGEAVDSIKSPWEHTKEEHEEAQILVNTAFAKDLTAAIKQAQSSPNYPRNLDLFHDVLTSEMYDLVVTSKLNKQPLAGWVLLIGGMVLGIGLAILVILAE